MGESIRRMGLENTIQYKLSKDLRKASADLLDDEARYLVDTYYQMQGERIRSDNQIAALVRDDSKKPHETLHFFAESYRSLENDIKACLEEYVKNREIGKWLLSICGIGPVLAAGLIAHIDINRVQTAGQIHAFAGLDPSRKWKKGQKRPHNAKLKVICWKIGQSFLKTSNRPGDVYGKIYRLRKEYEEKKNEALEYKKQAEMILKTVKIKKDTEAYKWYSQGKLPPGHINARAMRYAVKIFISHFFAVWYELTHKVKPPKPYAISILGHAHEVPIPNWEYGQVVLPEKRKRVRKNKKKAS